MKNKVTKNHFRTFAYVSDVFGGSERSKRSKSLKWRRWSSFRSKMTQAALWHTCPTFFDVFEAPKRVWALKTRFGATFALRRPETIKKRRTRMTKKLSHLNRRTFCSKVLLGSTWGTLGPAGAEAGWLAAEGAELRAEGSRLGPPPQPPPPAPSSPPPLLSPKVGILVRCTFYENC